MDSIQKIIAMNAIRLRNERGLTKKDVARRAGVSLLAYSNIEAGKINPKMKTIYMIAEAMGVGVQEFLSPIEESTDVSFREG